MVVLGSSDWFVSTWGDLWQVPVSAVVMLAVVVVAVRAVGLRSFSKMSSFDFAVTVSIGSILGSVAASSSHVVNGAVAIASLLGAQAAVSWVRARRRTVESTLDNSPILLRDGPDLLDSNLRLARVTESDVYAELREANVLRLQDVRAVVLETTGDISVLRGYEQVDPPILEGIRRRSAASHVDLAG